MSILYEYPSTPFFSSPNLWNLNLYQIMERMKIKVLEEWERHPANKCNSFSEAIARYPHTAAKALRARSLAVHHYSYAVPNEEVLHKIVDYAKDQREIIEIGCGKGYWAHLLKQTMVQQQETLQMQAIDNFAEIDKAQSLHFPVQKADGHEWLKANDTTQSCLFLCWPRELFLENFQGRKLIIIGEGKEGSTACLEHEDCAEEWDLTDIYEHPRWVGLCDKTYFYTRKEKF